MKIVLILILATYLSANIKQKMFRLYQDEKYKEACIKGASQFNKFRQDEELISLYAFACLKADFIDKLSIPIVILKKSKEARANSAYFSILLMQKKLLYRSLVDGYDLSSLKLPSTKHIFSKVFDLYTKRDKTKDIERMNGFYIFEDKDNKKIKYKLYLSQYKKSHTIIIEEFFNGLQIKKHIYR